MYLLSDLLWDPGTLLLVILLHKRLDNRDHEEDWSVWGLLFILDE
jgi:hypothetical protein